MSVLRNLIKLKSTKVLKKSILKGSRKLDPYSEWHYIRLQSTKNMKFREQQRHFFV